jgi:hypothetical protein
MLREPYKGDWITIRNMPAPDEDIVQKIADRQLVQRMMLTLTPRERIVVTQYFWEDETLRDVGKAQNVGAERIRQILLKAQRKMKCVALRMDIREYEEGVDDRRREFSEEHQRAVAERRRKERDVEVKRKIDVGNSLDQFLSMLPPGDPRRTTSPAGFVCEPHPADPNLFVFRWVKPLPWA